MAEPLERARLREAKVLETAADEIRRLTERVKDLSGAGTKGIGGASFAPWSVQSIAYPQWLHPSLESEYDRFLQMQAYVNRVFNTYRSPSREYQREWDANVAALFKEVQAASQAKYEE